MSGFHPKTHPVCCLFGANTSYHWLDQVYRCGRSLIRSGQKAENAVFSHRVASRREGETLKAIAPALATEERLGSPQVERFSKTGFPKFKKEQTHASVEYKTCGWVRFVLSKWMLSKDERQFQIVDYKTTGIDNLIIM